MVLEDLLHPMKVKVAQLDPPAMRETWVRSLGWEDPWRREQLPTRVFWPGEFHGLDSSWGCKGLDMTERLSLSKNGLLKKLLKIKTYSSEIP